MPAARLAAVLLVLGVATAYASAQHTPSVMEIRAGWKARAQRSVSASIAAAEPSKEGYYKEGYENNQEGYYEEKEICLVEVTRRHCS